MATSISLNDITNGVGSGSLCFPGDLGKNNFNYWMSFSFYQYQAPSFTSSMSLSDLGTIRLPLPNMMVDQQRINYEEVQAGLAAAAAISGFQSNGMRGLASGLASGGSIYGAQNITNKLGSLAGSDNLSGILLQQQGLAVNPFLTVLFKAPAFKRHQFTWKMHPSNPQESLMLNAIINAFTYNQLPDRAASVGGGSLLSYPNIVQLTISNANDSAFTYRFKPAVIEGFTKNFTPSGQASMFGSTLAPTEVELTLNLLEIEFWLQSDYGAQNGHMANAQAFLDNVNGQLNNTWDAVKNAYRNFNATDMAATSVNG